MDWNGDMRNGRDAAKHLENSKEQHSPFIRDVKFSLQMAAVAIGKGSAFLHIVYVQISA